MRFSRLIGRRLLTSILLLLTSLLIAQFLSSTARVQVWCGQGTPLLCEAIDIGDIGRVDALLRAGASADASGDSGWPPLMLAAMFDEPEICQHLIEHGASLEPGRGILPLSAAARCGHTQVIRVLLRGGARADASDRRGLTPLMDAAAFGYPEIVRILIAAGANVNAVDSDGDTACIIVAENPNSGDVMAELLRCGADVNIANANGDTALHVAARARNFTMISLLLKHGADAHHRNRAGEEPAFGDPASAEFAPPVWTRPEAARQP
jgi:ankyrin repeat protein